MAVKVIEAMDRPTKHRMKEAIEGLPQGDVKRLKGSGELYRLRVGGWRLEDRILISCERNDPD